MEARSALRLLLELENCLIELDRQRVIDAGPLCIGKDRGNDLIFSGEFTSRRHAHIEIRRNDFYLVDTSTNGTFVQTDDEHIHYLHRSSLRLWGGGWIAPGQPLHVARPIRFTDGAA